MYTLCTLRSMLATSVRCVCASGLHEGNCSYCTVCCRIHMCTQATSTQWQRWDLNWALSKKVNKLKQVNKRIKTVNWKSSNPEGKYVFFYLKKKKHKNRGSEKIAVDMMCVCSCRAGETMAWPVNLTHKHASWLNLQQQRPCNTAFWLHTLSAVNGR